MPHPYTDPSMTLLQGVCRTEWSLEALEQVLRCSQEPDDR